MNETNASFFAQNLDLWISVILALLIVFIVLVVIDMYNNKKTRSRYEAFMGINKKYKNAVDLEKLLIDCVGKADAIDEKYSKLLEIVQDMEKNMQFCCQEVGIVRYNPFEEMGGNLCFAIAILDAENTGVVINGIHSRTGTFTYAKPVELGVSTYILSKEEQEAIDKAKNSAYQAVKNTVTAKKPSKMLKAKKRKEKEEEIKNKVEVYKSAAARTKRKRNSRPVDKQIK